MPGRPRYFTPPEIAVHNIPSDCWVSFLGVVFNLTSLCEKYGGDILLKPIIAHAGKDISHWFDPQTRDVRRMDDSRVPLHVNHNDNPIIFILPFSISDKEAYPSSDRMSGTLHSNGSLRAHPSSLPSLGLGYRFWHTLVEKLHIHCGLSLSQNKKDSHHQYINTARTNYRGT